MTPLATLTNITGQDVSIRSDVLDGIRQASASTGVDFSYLMAQANRESSFDPTAQAKSSSASGLYQFVEQTWLGVVKNHGAEYGRGDLADKITRRSDGRFVVADAATRKEILGLRRDPTFAASMAAEHASDNQTKLEEKLGREVNGTDLYMAHFLGISGALKFLRTMEDSPNQTGASLFPKAAAANSNVFYTEDGRARSVSEIYNRFDKSMDADMAAYASLEEGDGTTFTTATAADDANVGSIPGTSLIAGLSLPAAPNAAYLGRFRTTATPDSRIDGANFADAGQSSLGKVGGLLSPLMLVTLAALPVSGDDENAAKDRNAGTQPRDNAPSNDGGQALDGTRARESAQRGSLFNRLDNPLGLDLLRTDAAI